MKNKRYMLIVILIIAIGFATVSTTMLINGNIKISTSTDELAVYFVNAKVNDVDDMSVILDPKNISFEANLMSITDQYKLSYSIINDEIDVSTNVSVSCTTSSNYISISNSWEDETVLNPLETKEGLITVNLMKTYAGDDSINAPVSCTIVGIPVKFNETTSNVTIHSNNLLTGLIYEEDEQKNPITLTDGYLVFFSNNMKVVQIDANGYFSVEGLDVGNHEVYYFNSDPSNLTRTEIEETNIASMEFIISNPVSSINFLIKRNNDDTEEQRNIVYYNEEQNQGGNFATDSWATIKAAVHSGNYTYQVGDIKNITLENLIECSGKTCATTGVNKNVTLRISNVSPCTNNESSETACGFVVEFTDIVTTHRFGPSVKNSSGNTVGSNVGGWPDSELRTYLNSTFLNSLPSDLKNIIADTTVVSGHGSKANETNFVSSDKIYLYSYKELYGDASSDTAAADTRQLDYYYNLGVTNTNYSNLIKYYNSVATGWWLRTATAKSTIGYFVVLTTGANSWGQSYGDNGIVPAFRID